MSLFTPPNVRATDGNNTLINGAGWAFTLTGTLTPASVYTTQALDVAHAYPVLSNSVGRFPPIYLDPAVTYRARFLDASGTLVPGYDFDPVAELVSFTPSQNNTYPRPINERLAETVSVLDFVPANKRAAILDYSSTDNVTTYIQAAINAVNTAGGGVITHPPGLYNVSGLALKAGVCLQGAGFPGTYGYPSAKKTTYKAVSAGWMVEAADGVAQYCGVVGIAFSGLGSGTAAKGVRIGASNYWCFIRNCQFDNLSGQAAQVAGLAAVVEDILVTNCLLTLPVAKTGTIEIGGTDNYANRIEASNNRGTVSNATNLYVCGIAVTGSNNFVSHCTGEESDVGFYVSGTRNKFTASRADLNWGHGWEIVAASNMLGECHALTNGLATTNTYDNFVLTAGGNSFDGCHSEFDGVILPRYSLRDTVNSDSSKNFYGPTCQWGTGYGTATFNLNVSAGGAVQIPQGPPKAFTAADTTPSVLGYGCWLTANVADTTITAFDDSVPGQELWLYADDAKTLITNGNGSDAGSISTAERKSKRLVNGQWYCFIQRSGVWFEVALEQAFRATQTYNPPSLATGVSAAIQTVTVTGAALGDKVEATFSLNLAGAVIYACVSAADTVSYFFQNVNGTNPLDLASGTVSVAVKAC